MTRLFRSVLAIVALTAALCVPAPASLADSDRASVADPGPDHDGLHVLVKVRDGLSASERAAVHAGAGAVQPVGAGVEAIAAPPSVSVDQLVDAYQRDPRVQWAEPNYRLGLAATPNDPLFPGNSAASPDLWGLHNTGQHAGAPDADMDAPEGWDLAGLAGTGPWPAAGYTVGIVDTGIDASHPDLADRVVTPCFTGLTGAGTMVPGCADDEGHGTHVSGTIAAIGNNGTGVVGVAPNARVLMCKSMDSSGGGWTADTAACINEMVERRAQLNLRVISLSIGGSDSNTLEAAIDNAAASGILVFAAAGNRSSTTLNYPAGYANAVSVAAIDRTGAKAPFSNYNSDVELAAPGVDIVSTLPGGGYGALSGTSMATPNAAGAAALVSWKTGKTGQALRDAVAGSADDLGVAGRDDAFGHGRVNLCRALGGCAAVAPPPAPTPPAPATLSGKAYRYGRTRSGVTVTYRSSASAGSARTNGYGVYSASLQPASYTVRAYYAGRYCRAGSRYGRTYVSVSLQGGAAKAINWYC